MLSATMQRMLDRRTFVGRSVASLAASALAPFEIAGQVSADSSQASSRFSIMMWALDRFGTFDQNLERVAQAGYRHVQLTGELKKWTDADYRRYQGRMQELKITVDAISGVGPGFADPAGGDAFVAGLKALIPTAQRLQCGQIIVLSGKRVGAPAVQHAAAVETLKRSVDVLSNAGIVLLIEPIDRIENPPIYLNGVTEAFEMARAVGSPNVKVLYDIYHEQREFGNLIEKFENNIDQVGLIHIADVPGRHEPGTGEINYPNIYRKLTQLNYKHNMAMEFYPSGDVVETIRRAREQAQAFFS